MKFSHNIWSDTVLRAKSYWLILKQNIEKASKDWERRPRSVGSGLLRRFSLPTTILLICCSLCFFSPLLPTGSSSVLPKGTLISGHWVWAAFERRVLSVCAPCWRNNTQTSSKLHHSVHFYSLVKHLLRCIRENGAGGISKLNLYFSGNLKVQLLALSKDSSCIPRPTLKFHYQEQKWCDFEVNFAWLVFGQDSSGWY